MGKASVNVQRGRLYLLARLPRKDGRPGSTPQRIPTGLFDTPADHRIADKRRVLLQRQIDGGTFSWDDWTEETKGTTWRKAINALYRKRVVLGRTSENTWKVNFMGRLRQVDMTKQVDSNEIARFLNRWPRDSCSYKEAFYLARDISQLINVAFPEVPIPTYKKEKLTDVPTDEIIVHWVQQANPELSWALGMLATYGLRPHELDKCRFADDKHRLQVDDKTKTGSRLVIPVLSEWVDLFDLRNERRRKKVSTDPASTSSWLHNQRRKLGMPFKPYSIRHAYAGRLWKIGGSQLDIYTAARLMGHSTKEHENTYREWIEPHTIAVRAEEALAARF